MRSRVNFRVVIPRICYTCKYFMVQRQGSWSCERSSAAHVDITDGKQYLSVCDGYKRCHEFAVIGP